MIMNSRLNFIFYFLVYQAFFYVYGQNWNLTGEWKGYVTQEVGIRNIYYCKLNLEQFGNQIIGGSYFEFFDDKDVFVTFSLKGEIRNNELLYQEIKVLKDYIPVKYSSSITGWCIKKANLKIIETQDSIKLIGDWSGVPNTGLGYCPPGKFYVAKPNLKSKFQNLNDSNTQLNKDLILPQNTNKGDKFIVPNIQFKPSTAELMTESYPILEKLSNYLKSRPELKIKIVGHTDIGKDDVYNENLSKARADAIKSYLLSQNIHSSRIQTEGKGNKEPIASNDNPEGRAKNRRVEIVILE